MPVKPAMSAGCATHPTCDRCSEAMEPSGWMLKPNGSGGLRRLTVFRCPSCGRLFDELWGAHDAAGDL